MVETCEKVSSSSSYAHKDLEFFKVFLPEFSSREVVIPPAFIDILEKPIPHEVSLLDEIGRLWCVKTKTEDTEERFRVVFEKGWEIFANDQSLEFGDFLVFSYDGDSRFFVTIFAKDGCKKDIGNVTTTNRSTVSVDREPVVVFTKPERRKDCGKRVMQKRKRDSVKEEPSVLVESEPESISTIKTEPEHGGSNRIKANQAGDVDPCDISCVTEKKHKGFEESVDNHPKNPHFVRNITNGSLHRLEIPTTFLKSNGIELEEDIELCDENGKKWPVKIVKNDRGLKFSYESWLCFCKSHKLMKTNKCLFEFIVARNGRCKEIQVRIVSGRLLTTMTKNNYQVLAM